MSTLPLLRLRPVLRFLQGPLRHSSPVSTSTPAPTPIDRVRQRNFDLLLESLASDGNPSRVWANYTNLVTFLGYERLPLELHQQVLRKCTPLSRLLRASATRRIFAGNVPRTPHIYEGRFQAIIRNIRAAGAQPSLDDYNFILEQFAAVGHHFGAMSVYRELVSLGIVPRTKTFGLCLQAIAHRLTLPVERQHKEKMTAVTRRMVSDLISAMKSYNIPFTSVNLDLTMRILKETTDMQGFEVLMKWGYGIDLANPDCPPLEYLQSTEADAIKPIFQPFSTAALNMTIDTLGRLKNISRMVQAFEVLTAPLPAHSSVPPSSSFDEDDDDDYGVAQPTLPFTPPSARPNTTTYNILLRHISQAGNAVLARHYLLQAMDFDREVMRRLKHDLGHMPLQEVPSPHFAINRGTLLSVFGETNRDKNAALMRWLYSKFPRILSKKRGELQFFTRYRKARQRKRLWPYENSTASAILELPSTIADTRARSSTKEPLSVKPSTRFTTITERWRTRKDVGAVFDLDLEDESAPLPARSKTFDLDLHIGVLQRDISEIEALYAHVQSILVRTTNRVKERLGRRVYRGKDMYLRTEGNVRQRVSPERWENIAGFRKSQPGSSKSPPQRVVFPWSAGVNASGRAQRHPGGTPSLADQEKR